MTTRINSNIAFSRASRHFAKLKRDSAVRMSRISTGQSINNGGEGGGRLSASEGMRAELRGLAQGTRNTENSIDLLRSAEGGMNEISAMLLRMRDLAVESSSSTLNNRNREALDAEFAQMKEYIDRVAKLATYNGKSLLKGFGAEMDTANSTAVTDAANTGVRSIDLFGVDAGIYTFTDNPGDNTLTLSNGTVSQTLSFGAVLVGDEIEEQTTRVFDFDHLGIRVELAGKNVKDFTGSYADGDLDGHTITVVDGIGGSFQLGSDALPADSLEYDIQDMTVGGTVINLAPTSVATMNSARAALAQIDGAIERTARERGGIGAVLNRLEHTLSFTFNNIEALQASESTIRDADYAWETSRMARNDVLSQGSLAAMIKSRIPVEMAIGMLTNQ